MSNYETQLPLLEHDKPLFRPLAFIPKNNGHIYKGTLVKDTLMFGNQTYINLNISSVVFFECNFM